MGGYLVKYSRASGVDRYVGRQNMHQVNVHPPTSQVFAASIFKDYLPKQSVATNENM